MMMTDKEPSFMLHDPGGKVRLRLAGGVVGHAEISPCQRYRCWLSREWTPYGQAPKSILFLGMNPSVADAFASDPTVNREEGFARLWGYNRYFKGNILDWRATKPADLPHDVTTACSDRNLEAILVMAQQSEIVVAAHGKLHKRYQSVVERTMAAIKDVGTPIKCFGKNLDGSPKHPLYLRKDSILIDY